MDQQSSTPQVPSPATPVPVQTDTKSPQSTPSSGGLGGREFMLVGLALAGGGLITVALLMGRGSAATNAAPAAGSAATAPAGAGGRAAVKPMPWSAARRELWLGDRRKGIAYDVTANEPVGAWMKNVRPILVVRCTKGTMETFVVTDTAAQIEPKSENHTVTLRFDDQPPTTERWPDSAEHDALFAPDGAAFAARIAAARELQFGFIPHNSSPVVARFYVADLAPLLEPAAKHCYPAKTAKRPPSR